MKNDARVYVWALFPMTLGLALVLLTGCDGEDRRCRIFCQGVCGNIEGCNCGDCGHGSPSEMVSSVPWRMIAGRQGIAQRPLV